jgi:hypothetical protein
MTGARSLPRGQGIVDNLLEAVEGLRIFSAFWPPSRHCWNFAGSIPRAWEAFGSAGAIDEGLPAR